MYMYRHLCIYFNGIGTPGGAEFVSLLAARQKYLPDKGEWKSTKKERLCLRVRLGESESEREEATTFFFSFFFLGSVSSALACWQDFSPEAYLGTARSKVAVAVTVTESHCLSTWPQHLTDCGSQQTFYLFASQRVSRTAVKRESTTHCIAVQCNTVYSALRVHDWIR